MMATKQQLAEPATALLLRFGPSRSASPASRSDSAACLRSFWSFLSSSSLGRRLAVGQPPVGACAAYSKASATFSRSSASSMTRWTYGLASTSAALRAFAALLLRCHCLLLASLACPVPSLYPALCDVHARRLRPLARAALSATSSTSSISVDEDELEVVAQVLGDVLDVGAR